MVLFGDVKGIVERLIVWQGKLLLVLFAFDLFTFDLFTFDCFTFQYFNVVCLSLIHI